MDVLDVLTCLAGVVCVLVVTARKPKKAPKKEPTIRDRIAAGEGLDRI